KLCSSASFFLNASCASASSFIFFFSSRRRHTRSDRDWSSDVCSSDLGSNGSFGLWGVGGGDGWLDAYVIDFLTRAREKGFAVPDVAFKLALDRLRNIVATAPDISKNGGRDLAYALYVLARNGTAPLGDLRYL